MSYGFVKQLWQTSCLPLIYYRINPLSLSWAVPRTAAWLPELAG